MNAQSVDLETTNDMKGHCHNFPFRPPRLALLLLAGSLTIHWTVVPSQGLGDAAILPGFLLAVGGIALMTWAWALFRQANTPICPSEVPVKFVATGPYRFTRNPMYCGLLAFLVGVGVAVGTWPVIIAPAVFFVAMTRYFIPLEEQRLEAQFGEAYRDYCQKVRRWI